MSEKESNNVDSSRTKTYEFTVRFWFKSPKENVPDDGYIDVLRTGIDEQYAMLDAIRDIKENIANDHLCIYKAEIVEKKPLYIELDTILKR